MRSSFLFPHVHAKHGTLVESRGWEGRWTATALVSLLSSAKRSYLQASSLRLGKSKITEDIPISTARTPRGVHRGPNKRQISEKETTQWLQMRRWELVMKDEWDEVEPFRHLPKPKRQFGNEACEIIWPYVLLMQEKHHVHSFTKSIYVYYPQRSLSKNGEFCRLVAQRFSRQFLVPICFHNNHVYVETEMLLERSDTPWVVVNCLDGRHCILPVTMQTLAVNSRNGNDGCPPIGSTEGGGGAAAAASQPSQEAAPLDLASNPVEIEAAARRLLTLAQDEADRLGTTVEDVPLVKRQLNERPLQNAFIRVDYQWFGDTQEQRMTHLVQWMDVAGSQYQAKAMRNRHSRVLSGLNYADPEVPTGGNVRSNLTRHNTRTSGASVVLQSPSKRTPRVSPMFSRGANKQV